MEVSWNRGTPKSSGVPPFMETTISHMLHGAGIFTHICPKKYPNVGKYTIHWAYGYGISKTGPKITGPLLEFALGLLQQRLLRFQRSQWISGKQRRLPVTRRWFHRVQPIVVIGCQREIAYNNWLVVYLPLWKLWVSWDDDIPNWMESHKSHVPNHQADNLQPTNFEAYIDEDLVPFFSRLTTPWRQDHMHDAYVLHIQR